MMYSRNKLKSFKFYVNVCLLAAPESQETQYEHRGVDSVDTSETDRVNSAYLRGKMSTFLSELDVFLPLYVCRSSVGRASLLAVPEVTVRSVTAAFTAAVVRVKRTVNPSEEAGGPQHYLRLFLSCPLPLLVPPWFITQTEDS